MAKAKLRCNFLNHVGADKSTNESHRAGSLSGRHRVPYRVPYRIRFASYLLCTSIDTLSGLFTNSGSLSLHFVFADDTREGVDRGDLSVLCLFGIVSRLCYPGFARFRVWDWRPFDRKFLQAYYWSISLGHCSCGGEICTCFPRGSEKKYTRVDALIGSWWVEAVQWPQAMTESRLRTGCPLHRSTFYLFVALTKHFTNTLTIVLTNTIYVT